MSIQSSVGAAPLAGKAGMLCDSGYHDVLSGVASSRKRVSVAVVADANDVYTITINGTDFDYTDDGSASTAEITVGLRNAINAGSEPVLASGTDTPLIIVSTIDGPAGDFTYADGVVGVGTLTETVLVEQGQTMQNGLCVVLDTEQTSLGDFDYAVRSPRLAADITGGLALGCIIEELSIEQLPASVGSAYDTSLTLGGNRVVNVLHEGRCYVTVEAAVTKGGQAYARYASGAGGSTLGAWRGDGDTSTAAAYPRAKFLTSAGAGEIAVLELVR